MLDLLLDVVLSCLLSYAGLYGSTHLLQQWIEWNEWSWMRLDKVLLVLDLDFALLMCLLCLTVYTAAKLLLLKPKWLYVTFPLVAMSMSSYCRYVMWSLLSAHYTYITADL